MNKRRLPYTAYLAIILVILSGCVGEIREPGSNEESTDYETTFPELSKDIQNEDSSSTEPHSPYMSPEIEEQIEAVENIEGSSAIDDDGPKDRTVEESVNERSGIEISGDITPAENPNTETDAEFYERWRNEMRIIFGDLFPSRTLTEEDLAELLDALERIENEQRLGNEEAIFQDKLGVSPIEFYTILMTPG